MGYRKKILEEFKRRKEKNIRYSMRAFARDLDTGITALSSCLSGKRHLSSMNLRKIQGPLNWSDETLAKALQEVAPKQKPVRGAKTHDLPLDIFNQIGNWYTLAILNLAKMPSNLASADWIAERLNISPEEALSSLELLQALDLISIDGPSMRATHDGHLRFAEELPESTLKGLQIELSKRAINSLSDVKWPHRLFLATLFNGDRNEIQHAVPKIHRFANTMKSSFSKTDGEDVIALVIHAFPLTQKQRTSD